jgi:hypothetical protein
MSVIKTLAHKPVTKKVKFMGADVDIHKLSIAQVLEVQSLAKEATEEDTFSVMNKVLCLGIPDFNELTVDEFQSFPLEDLTKLSEEVMKFAGLMEGKAK